MDDSTRWAYTYKPGFKSNKVTCLLYEPRCLKRRLKHRGCNYMRSSSVRGRLGLPTLITRSTIYTLVPILRHRAHILVGASVVPELCGCTSGYPAWTSATPPKICADKRAHGPVTPREVRRDTGACSAPEAALSQR